MKLFKNILIVGCLIALSSCSSNSQKSGGGKDDILTGNLPVLVDESVLPILIEQIQVFESSYTNAKIEPIAKAEVQLVNSLIGGEAAMAVMTRELNDQERKSFDQRSIKPRIYKVGYDGIVLLKHISSTDSSIRIADISNLMKGERYNGASLVFDNLNGSAFRYLKERANVDKVANTFVEGKSSLQEMLEEVEQSPNKIGVLSLNQYLSLESSFSKKDKFRILSVQNDSLASKKYVKPSQATLSTNEYPLKRDILVLNYQPNMGLGIGFSAFMTGDRGQRIVLKSGLLPATMPGREIIIRDKIN